LEDVTDPDYMTVPIICEAFTCQAYILEVTEYLIALWEFYKHVSLKLQMWYSNVMTPPGPVGRWH